MAGPADILGVILAGGQGRRMGGVDKALVPFAGRPLIAHVIERFAPQVGRLVISANGDPARYAAFGLEVIADPLDENAGPLAGLAAGLLHAGRLDPPPRRIATVAVDTPALPLDLVARLAAAVPETPPTIAVATSGGRTHPVAALHPVAWTEDLLAGLASGEMRRVMRWIGGRPHVLVDFAIDGTADPFANLNTPDDLLEAEARSR